MMQMLFFPGCQTSRNHPVLSIPHPPIPEPASLLPVHFSEIEDEGLLLSYDNYRNLKHNIIEYRREIADLRDTVVFYRNTIQEAGETE